jgi:hypothetical protein
MIYLSHGYIDIFNYELKHINNNAVRLITNSNDIVFQCDEVNRYNSKTLVDIIFQKVLMNLNRQSAVYSNVQFKKSSFKFAPKDHPYNGHSWHNHKLEIKLRPSEDTAKIFIDDLNIIATFSNEISCTKQEYIVKKRVILEENCSRLITIPQHDIQIPLNHCSSYNKFKKMLLDSLCTDIRTHLISEFEALNLSKWDIVLGQTNLDIENLINDNMKILIS